MKRFMMLLVFLDQMLEKINLFLNLLFHFKDFFRYLFIIDIEKSFKPNKLFILNIILR